MITTERFLELIEIEKKHKELLNKKRKVTYTDNEEINNIIGGLKEKILILESKLVRKRERKSLGMHIMELILK